MLSGPERVWFEPCGGSQQSAGSRDDAGYRDVLSIEQSLGMDVILHGQNEELGTRSVRRYRPQHVPTSHASLVLVFVEFSAYRACIVCSV